MGLGTRQGLRRSARRGVKTLPYRLARALESHAFGLTPEQWGFSEGLRAAVAVSVMVALAYITHDNTLAWAAFAAFWACLADPGGAPPVRQRAIGGFVLGGVAVLPIVTLAGAHGPVYGAGAIAACLFLANLTRALGASATLPGILVSVVAVVGVEYTCTPHQALLLAAAFAMGGAWAMLFCLFLWPVPAYVPARRATASLFQRLADMTGEFHALLTREGASPAPWMQANATHRRALRLAMARAQALVDQLETNRPLYAAKLDAAERVFAALIAAGHELATHPERAPQAKRPLWHLHRALIQAAHATRHPEHATPGQTAEALARDASQLSPPLGPALRLAAQSLAGLGAPPPPQLSPAPRATRPRLHRPGPVLRHAARLSAGVLLTYGVSVWLGLSFSYWATMATVMVMQPATEATWPRTLERILGSVGGGLLAALLLGLIPGKLALFALIIPLATLTIGLKSVNYTLFVLFLTPLFVLVISLFQPQEGIPIARALNNVLGALIGLGATALLWPEPQTSQFEQLLAEAVHANLSFASLVLGANSPDETTEAARRAAGLKSSLAETALRRKRLEGQSKRARLESAETLLSQLRLIAGAATVERVSPHPASPQRAQHYTNLANLYAAHLAARRRYPLPTPATEPDDDLGHAIAALTAQLHTREG